MTEKDTLDEIAEQVGEIIEEQDPEAEQGKQADESDEGPEDMGKRNMNDYDGGW